MDWEEWELELAHEGLPAHWGRTHWSTAELLTEVKEFLSPRYLEEDPDEPEPKKPPRARKPWTIEENLPPFAESPLVKPELEPVARKLLDEHGSDLPAWALEILQRVFDWRPL